MWLFKLPVILNNKKKKGKSLQELNKHLIKRISVISYQKKVSKDNKKPFDSTYSTVYLFVAYLRKQTYLLFQAYQ